MRWLRRRIVRSIYQRTVRWFAALFAALCLAALVRGGLRVEAGTTAVDGAFDLTASGRLGSEPLRPSDVVAALFVSQILVGARLLLAIEFNPLNRRYLGRYTEQSLRFRAVRPDGDPHPVAEPLGRYGVHPNVVVGRAPSAGEPLDPAMESDIYQSDNRLVTVAVGRVSGSITVLTELDDRRIVVTSDLVMLPHESMVVNALPGASLPELLKSHRSLLESLVGRAPRAGRAVRATAASPEVFTRSMQLEQASFQCLGPVVGSFCDLALRRWNWRLVYRLDPKAILALSFSDEGSSALPPLRRTAPEPSGTSVLVS